MKTKVLIPVLILIAVIIGLIYSKKEPVISNTAHKVILRNKEPRKTIKQARYTALKNRPSTLYPTECFEPMNKLTGNSFEEYAEIMKSKSSFQGYFGEKCFEGLKDNSFFQDLLKRSNCSLKENESVEKNGSCISFLFHLKSFLIVDMSKNKSLNELTPVELAANVVKMFFDLDKLDKKSLKENLKVINQLYESYPNDPDVVQAYAGYMIIGKMITKDKSISSKIDGLLDQNEGLDFKIDRMKPLDDFANDNLPSAKIALDKLESRYPKEADVSYYQAAYYWRMGNVEMAKNYLNQAISKGSNCSYCSRDVYTETQRRMSGAKPGDKGLFSVSIGLNFDNL